MASSPGAFALLSRGSDDAETADVTSWFEKRRERRRKRERMEEIIAWFVVPVIVIALGWGFLQVKDMIAGTPFMSILTGKDKNAP
jgi:hypothetical protein